MPVWPPWCCWYLCSLSSGGAALTAGGAGIDIVLVGAITWLICSLTGSLAGSYQSINLPVQLLVMGGCVLVGVVFLIVGDPTEAWQVLMIQLYQDLGGRGFQMPGEEELRAAAQIMTGLMAASAVASMILALIIGGWLAGPVTGSPLSTRFTGLRMGYVIGGLAALAGIASVLSLGSLADNLLLVLVMGFVFQGLAVVHWQARSRGWPSFWPLALYLPMAMPPLSMLVLVAVSAVGFTDNWYNLRRPRVDMIK